MKTINTIMIFVFILLFTGILFPQQNWTWQNPLPQGNNLNDIQAINKNIGYACGDMGTILKTVSGGTNWKLLNFPIHANLTKIDFINNDDGWTAGTYNNSAFVYQTTNGGDSWKQILAVKGSSAYVLFLNNDTGLVSIDSTLYYTNNAGKTWSIKNFPYTISSIFFLNDSTGWLAADKNIYKTTDNGNNWKAIEAVKQFNINLNKIQFINDSTGYLTGTAVGPNEYSGFLYKTTNGGVTWIGQDTVGIPLRDYRTFNDMEFYNQYLGWTIAGGEVYKTNNGKNWSQISFVQYLSHITIIDSLNLWGSGEFGSLYISTDGGYNWQKSYTGYINQTNDIQVLNNKSIFVAGGKTILKTFDGGEKWESIKIESTGNDYFEIHTVWFTDSLNGWIGVENSGGWGKLYRTTDGGLDWSVQVDSVLRIFDIYFINNKTGWFFAGNNSYRTDDSGNTWNLQIGNMPSAEIESIYFISPDTGFAGGYSGLYKTTDGGNNWAKINLIVPDIYIKSISFTDSDLGWAAGYKGNNGYVLKTTDGGTNWSVRQLMQISYTVWPLSIDFTNKYNGWVVGITGNNGFAFHTSDSGNDWQTIQLPLNFGLNKVVFSNNSDGWILGSYGSIVHTTNGGITFIQNNKNITPEKFKLYQNYPNPFNPVTTIKYQLSSSGYVTLKIYDILGNVVKTLVDGYKPEGKYYIGFNASNLASGVYFYQLRSTGTNGSNLVSVKKMILLK